METASTAQPQLAATAPSRRVAPGRAAHLALLAALALAPSATAATGSGPTFHERFGFPDSPARLAPDHPFEGEVRGHLQVPDHSAPPVAFAPLPDGTVLALLAHPPRLLHLDGERSVSEHELNGPGFDPAQAALVDLLPLGTSQVLLLDQAAGTLWVADRRGRVRRRRGLFVGPTRFGRGADGSVLVRDAMNNAVVVLDVKLEQVFSRRAHGTYPAATEDGHLPFLRRRRDGSGVLVGLMPAQGAEPGARTVATLSPPPGMTVLHQEVLGIQGDEIFVRVLSARPQDQAPRDSALWVVPANADEGSAAPRRAALPTPLNQCPDCGPDFRLGPTGRIWMYARRGQDYWVLRLAPLSPRATAAPTPQEGSVSP